MLLSMLRWNGHGQDVTHFKFSKELDWDGCYCDDQLSYQDHRLQDESHRSIKQLQHSEDSNSNVVDDQSNRIDYPPQDRQDPCEVDVHIFVSGAMGCFHCR